MEIAAKILIVGGVLNLAYGFVTGFLIARIRMGSPTVPKYLMLAHTGPFMQGAMLLGLNFALIMSTLSDDIEQIAAFLLVLGSALLALKDTLNWLASVEDEFSEKPTGIMELGAASVLCSTIGMVIVLYGVLTAI